MAILESVKKLASKVGADTNGRTIAEQINNINRHLDSTGSRDIAEAVSKFADKEDGTAKLGTKTITENNTYIALDDELDGYSSVTVNVAAPTPETFEVEMTITSGEGNSGTFTTSKTLQETIDAIEAGKQINFSATFDGKEVNVICYGVHGAISIFMMVFDGDSIYPIYWLGNGDAYSTIQTPVMVAGAQT